MIHGFLCYLNKQINKYKFQTLLIKKVFKKSHTVYMEVQLYALNDLNSLKPQKIYKNYKI